MAKNKGNRNQVMEKAPEEVMEALQEASEIQAPVELQTPEVPAPEQPILQSSGRGLKDGIIIRPENGKGEDSRVYLEFYSGRQYLHVRGTWLDTKGLTVERKPGKGFSFRTEAEVDAAIAALTKLKAHLS